VVVAPELRRRGPHSATLACFGQGMWPVWRPSTLAEPCVDSARSDTMAFRVPREGVRMGKFRTIALAAAVLGGAVLLMAVATAQSTDARPTAIRTAVVASVTIPSTPLDSPPVFVPVTVRLAEGTWHVTGEGDPADCLLPTTTGRLIGDIVRSGGAAGPSLVVDVGRAGGTVTLVCHNQDVDDNPSPATERLVAVPIVMQ